MGPIEVEIVFFFVCQFAWMTAVCLLFRYIFKLKGVIYELRSTIAPFAELYQSDKYKETHLFTHHDFKRAFDVYLEDR